MLVFIKCIIFMKKLFFSIKLFIYLGVEINWKSKVFCLGI